MRLEPALRQLVLDLPVAQADGIEDFLRDQSNASAFDAVLAWPEWPASALIVDGPAGCGKSHLARIWAGRVGAAWLPADRLHEFERPLDVLGERTCCAVDDADRVRDEVLLLQLYNITKERGGHLMLTASSPLAAWLPRLPDLSSRLKTAWTAPITAPRDELLAAVMVKQFHDRQLQVSAEIIQYLLRTIERSFDGARRAVHAIDRASLHAKRPITLPLARRALELVRDQDQPHPNEE